MSGPTALEVDAARRRLAHALGVEVDALGPVAAIEDATTIRLLERAVRRHLAQAEAARLTAVVAAARRLPTKLVAAVAQRQFGPELCAAAIGAVDADLAVAIASHLQTDFMVEVTLAADPSSAGHLAAALPPATTTAIARGVIARREDLVAAAFVGPIPPAQVAKVVAGVDDHAAVVRIALYVDDPDLLDPIVADLDEAYLTALIGAVQAEGHWPEGLNLVGHLSPAQQARVGRVAADLDDHALAAVLQAARTHGLWQGLLALARNLDEALVARVAGFPLWADPDVLAELVAVVEDDPSLAGDLAGVVDHVPAATVAALAGLVADTDDLPAVVRIAAAIDEPDRLGAIVDLLADEAVVRLMRTVVAEAMWPEGLALLRRLDPPRRQRLVGLADALDEASHPALAAAWADLDDPDRTALIDGLDDLGPLAGLTE